MLRPLLGMLVAATMVPVAAATADPLAPSSVVLSGDSPLGTNLFWTRGQEAADAYRVYGLSDSGVPTLIVEVPAGDAGAWVLEGLPAFSGFGVSALRGDVESLIQEAFDAVDELQDPCIFIYPEQPRVRADCLDLDLSPPPIAVRFKLP